MANRYLIRDNTLTDLADSIRYKANIEGPLTIEDMISKIRVLSTTGEKPINFEVVGGTVSPTSPEENTIWVNTDVNIGEWQVSAVKPTTRIDGTYLRNGDVWIATTGTANANIQVVKYIGVWFKIAKCCQYINNTWVLKEVKIYQGGSWIGCRYTILDGREVSHSPVVHEGSGTNSCGATLQFIDTGIYYKSKHDSDKNECYYEIVWTEPIDLTNYDTCYITFGKVSGGRSGNDIGFSTGIEWRAKCTISAVYAGNTTYTLDVSGLSGLHYLRLNGRRPASDVFSEIYIQKVYLE